ncbi:gluconate 2-dehydrogenase subunit 3 family protein [Pseudomonas sp. RIT-PI-AD]|uniref:gluconate 2-dehydrogenase subunit 3 family protein n=1 Tax=Pseudomonas sp. RIT-PI-AD TaxID=3035294 RepID=UPI0021D81294|nr:gluconate 2-dehydrogenase subunit 3 family protein [Pseudomonas sp. RIT-PI-AD]
MSADDDIRDSRRDFLRKSLTLIPVVTVAGSGLGAALPALSADPVAARDTPVAPPAEAYRPTFFTAEEWAFVKAAVARLIPADANGPGALEAGVPEFIDRQMSTPYATGANWYMQGPFVTDAPVEFGYQLKLVPRDIYRLGIAAADAWCRTQYGKVFAELDGARQDEALGLLEAGKAEFDALPAKVFFAYLLTNTKEGFFCDPIHGGNKGLVGWTLINFPGARADFMDWVERGERYPLPPVSIRGERA